jgi:hypothetical protein
MALELRPVNNGKQDLKRCEAQLLLNGSAFSRFSYWSIAGIDPSHSAFIDSMYLLGSLFATKLGISFRFPHEVSPRLKRQIPTVSRYLGLEKRNPAKRAIHSFRDTYLYKTAKRRAGLHAPNKKTAQLYTLGLDSFYTLLSLKRTPDYLLYIQGYDLKIEDSVLFHKVEETIRKISKTLGTQTAILGTDVRETSDRFIQWDQMHGAACASAAYLCRDYFGTLYVNNVMLNKPVKNFWGSGDHLEPLYSTEYLEIKSFGHDKNRFEKALELSKSKHFGLVMNYVRTCWHNELKKEDEFNCCKCEKCARTFLALAAATGSVNIPAFSGFRLEYLDVIQPHYNPETMLSWKAIYDNLIKKFGTGSDIVRKSKKFVIMP